MENSINRAKSAIYSSFYKFGETTVQIKKGSWIVLSRLRNLSISQPSALMKRIKPYNFPLN